MLNCGEERFEACTFWIPYEEFYSDSLRTRSLLCYATASMDFCKSTSASFGWGTAQRHRLLTFAHSVLIFVKVAGEDMSVVKQLRTNYDRSRIGL